MLEYATAEWVAYRVKDINKQDMVQHQAAHFVTRDYWQTISVSSILDQLGLPSLSDRCLNSRLRIFGKAVVQSSRQTRHSDPDLSFTTLTAHTDVYNYSFFQEQYVIETP